MLALQSQHGQRMGSSKPPDHDSVFGFSFDPNSHGYPMPSPPVPAHGTSLLDDNESKFMDNFFEGVGNDHYTGDFFTNAGEMDHLGFGWQDLPPAFMGTSSSYGQQPLAMPDHLSVMTYGNMNGHGQGQISPGHMGQISPGHGHISPGHGHISPGMPHTSSSEILAAAAALHNGHGNSHVLGNPNGTPFSSTSMVPSSAPSHQSSQHIMSYPQQNLRSVRSSRDEVLRDTYYSEMVFGPSHYPGSRPHSSGVQSKAIDLRWGSDVAFESGQSFVAPAGQESIEIVEQDKLGILDCLHPQTSTAASTCPSSPQAVRLIESSKKHREEHDDTEEEVAYHDIDTKPRKRRKSARDEFDDDQEDSPSKKSLKKRKAKSTNSLAPLPSTDTIDDDLPAAKRRKSAASAAAKANRENLTEDQKRENHIKSEQKRRTLIKEGFDDLGELVPDLRSGGFSKSAVLVMAADFLEDLIKGNAILKKQLEGMGG